MKRNLVFVLFALVSVVGFSQVSWNAKVGMNISNFTGDFDMNAKEGCNDQISLNPYSMPPPILNPTLAFISKSPVKLLIFIPTLAFQLT